MLSIEGIAGDSMLVSHASLPGFVWFAANSAQLSKPIPSLLVRIDGQRLWWIRFTETPATAMTRGPDSARQVAAGSPAPSGLCSSAEPRNPVSNYNDVINSLTVVRPGSQWAGI